MDSSRDRALCAKGPKRRILGREAARAKVLGQEPRGPCEEPKEEGGWSREGVVGEWGLIHMIILVCSRASFSI